MGAENEAFAWIVGCHSTTPQLVLLPTHKEHDRLDKDTDVDGANACSAYHTKWTRFEIVIGMKQRGWKGGKDHSTAISLGV
jgi:hypothetical protein